MSTSRLPLHYVRTVSPVWLGGSAVAPCGQANDGRILHLLLGKSESFGTLAITPPPMVPVPLDGFSIGRTPPPRVRAKGPLTPVHEERTPASAASLRVSLAPIRY